MFEESVSSENGVQIVHHLLQINDNRLWNCPIARIMQLLPAQSASKTLLEVLWDVAVFPVMESRDACLVWRDLETCFFHSSFLAQSLVSVHFPSSCDVSCWWTCVQSELIISLPARSWTFATFWSPTHGCDYLTRPNSTNYRHSAIWKLLNNRCTPTKKQDI